MQPDIFNHLNDWTVPMFDLGISGVVLKVFNQPTTAVTRFNSSTCNSTAEKRTNSIQIILKNTGREEFLEHWQGKEDEEGSMRKKNEYIRRTKRVIYTIFGEVTIEEIIKFDETNGMKRDNFRRDGG